MQGGGIRMSLSSFLIYSHCTASNVTINEQSVAISDSFLAIIRPDNSSLVTKENMSQARDLRIHIALPVRVVWSDQGKTMVFRLAPLT